MTDLSTRHEPVSDLFPPVDGGDLSRYQLTEDQIASYRKNGYVGPIRVLNDEQVNALRADLQALMDPSHPGHDLFYEYHSNESTEASRVLFHALGAWRITPAFHDLLWHLAITVPASQLLGGAVRFWHDQLVCKPAHHGAVVPWHQDYSYWTRTKPMAHLTCWVALDESTRANGCVHYVPGSHRWDLLPIPEGRLGAKMEAIKTVLTDAQKAAFKPVPVEAKPGEGIIHDAMVLHGSYENTTDIPRRAAIVNLFRDGTRSASDEPLLEGVPAIPSGQPMGGQFFPLLLGQPPA